MIPLNPTNPLVHKTLLTLRSHFVLVDSQRRSPFDVDDGPFVFVSISFVLESSSSLLSFLEARPEFLFAANMFHPSRTIFCKDMYGMFIP